MKIPRDVWAEAIALLYDLAKETTVYDEDEECRFCGRVTEGHADSCLAWRAKKFLESLREYERLVP